MFAGKQFIVEAGFGWKMMYFGFLKEESKVS